MQLAKRIAAKNYFIPIAYRNIDTSSPLVNYFTSQFR